jgi:hypothetical protein
MALDWSAGGAESEAGVPLGESARKGTRELYLSMYASRVTAGVGWASNQHRRRQWAPAKAKKENAHGPKIVDAPS